MNEFRIPDAPAGFTIPPAFRFFEQPSPAWDPATRAAAMLAYALAYADFGWPVFPCCAPRIDDPNRCQHHPDGRCGDKLGKSPLISGGFQNATTDVHQIRRWWQRWPGANIAVSCEAAGVFVIDADAPKPRKNADKTPMVDAEGRPVMTANGRDTVDAFYDALGPMVIPAVLPTLHAFTPNGGMHWYWRLPNEMLARGWRVRSRTGVLPSVDTKATGGYVMLPPSSHVVGRHYLWDDCWTGLDDNLNLTRLEGREGIVVAPKELISALRDLGLIYNVNKDEQRGAARSTPPPAPGDGAATVAGTGDAASMPASGEVDSAPILRDLEDIIARTLPLAEGTAWQSWEPVDPKNPSGTWGWVDHAGRDEFLFRQVACRARAVLAPLTRTGKPEDKELAAKALLETVKKANKKLADALPEVDVTRIVASASRDTYGPAGDIIAGGRRTERGRAYPERPAPRLHPDATRPVQASTSPTASSTSPSGKKRKPKQDPVAMDKARWGR